MASCCTSSDRADYRSAPERPGVARAGGSCRFPAANGEPSVGRSCWNSVRAGGFADARWAACASGASANQSVPRQ